MKANNWAKSETCVEGGLKVTQKTLDKIIREIESVEFGSVVIVIKESRIVRIDTMNQKYVG